MTTFPKFEGFAITVTAEEVEASKKSFGPRLTPGEHELEILAVDYKGPIAADNTWLRYNLTVGFPDTKAGPDGKFKGVMYHNVMVPTQDIRYKEELKVFCILQAFFDGLGESLTPSTVSALIPQYFSDPKTLTGVKLKALLGYKKPYVDYVDGKYVIKNKDGTLFNTSQANSFSARESAEGQAFTDAIELQKYIEVLRIQPGVKTIVEAKPKSKTKASTDW